MRKSTSANFVLDSTFSEKECTIVKDAIQSSYGALARRIHENAAYSAEDIVAATQMVLHTGAESR